MAGSLPAFHFNFQRKLGNLQKLGAPRHHHRNAGFIRQQHTPVAHLPDESGVPRGRGIVHWW
jgi:hypothetical protein